VLAQVSELSVKGFIEVAKTEKLNLLGLFLPSLGRGEAETIVLASELKADIVLLDDSKARRTARKLDLKVMGTLGVLKRVLSSFSGWTRLIKNPLYLKTDV
jgi:predicted nucleic acid-binding protein